MGGITAIHGVDGGECDKERQICLRPVDAVEAQTNRGYDGHCVFSAIHQVRENISSIDITSHALQSSPYRRQCGKKAHQS